MQISWSCHLWKGWLPRTVVKPLWTILSARPVITLLSMYLAPVYKSVHKMILVLILITNKAVEADIASGNWLGSSTVPKQCLHCQVTVKHNFQLPDSCILSSVRPYLQIINSRKDNMISLCMTQVCHFLYLFALIADILKMFTNS